MLIAIHKRDGGFAKEWISFCKKKELEYIEVNCYDNDIIKKLKGVTHLLWHYHRYEVKNGHIASQLLGVFENMSIKVFPNFNTRLSFDEKILQKYLLESIDAPMPQTDIFFDRGQALNWVDKELNTKWVFKLSKGAGSKNVSLVDGVGAKKLISTMFSKGFPSFVPPKLQLRSKPLYNLYRHFTKRILLAKTKNKLVGREFGYAYFQEFLPKNDHDIRIVIFANKAIGLKRLVKKGSFKASGSGHIDYDKNTIPLDCINKAFRISKLLDFQFMAYDFVKHPERGYLIVEICHGVAARSYEKCQGYWTKDLKWHNNPHNEFILEHQIIQDLLDE